MCVIIGISPDVIAGPNWQDHVEAFMQKITSLEGVRLPARRQQPRDTGPRQINLRLPIPLKICSELTLVRYITA